MIEVETLKMKMSGESFPPEIIHEILIKLPVKLLLRCKSVCKEWYSFISDQFFIKAHYALSSSNLNYHRLIFINGEERNETRLTICPLDDVLFNNSINNASLLENPYPRPDSRCRIVGSCNGLVCILVDHGIKTLLIYNPSTRITNILPFKRKGAISSSFFGFGYDETTHDYKVVKLWRGRDRTRPFRTMIYSLKTTTWKVIGCFPGVKPFKVFNTFKDGTFFKGFLHWTPGAGDIVSLDLGKETYGQVLQPKYAEGSKRLTLGVLGEWLCVSCNYYERHVVDVWVMKVYGVNDSWTKLVSISDLNDRNLIHSYPKSYAPLCISNDGKLLLQSGTKLVVYDCMNGSYSEIQNFNVRPGACIFVESLVSPLAPLGEEN